MGVDWRVARGGNRKRLEAAAVAVSWKLRLKKAGLGLAALGAIAATAGAARETYRFLTAGQPLRIREVRFAGRQRASEQELAEAATVRRGDNLLRADLAQLERAVAKVPWVKRAEARRRFPAAVEVRLEEHQPAALVELSGLYLVSSDWRTARPSRRFTSKPTRASRSSSAPRGRRCAWERATSRRSCHACRRCSERSPRRAADRRCCTSTTGPTRPG